MLRKTVLLLGPLSAFLIALTPVWGQTPAPKPDDLRNRHGVFKLAPATSFPTARAVKSRNYAYLLCGIAPVTRSAPSTTSGDFASERLLDLYVDDPSKVLSPSARIEVIRETELALLLWRNCSASERLQSAHQTQSRSCHPSRCK